MDLNTSKIKLNPRWLVVCPSCQNKINIEKRPEDVEKTFCHRCDDYIIHVKDKRRNYVKTKGRFYRSTAEHDYETIILCIESTLRPEEPFHGVIVYSRRKSSPVGTISKNWTSSMFTEEVENPYFS